jgi:hypothetical protein
MRTTSFRLLSRFRPARGSDDGFAMITVLGIALVMTALVVGSLTYAAQVTPQARQDQDWNAALAAAQAGVDDYVSRLNKSDSYALSVDCTNLALQGPNAGTNSCGWNSSTAPGWQQVNPDDTTSGYFHYDPIYASGSVRLVSTGKVRNSYRSVEVRVARGGSTDYLYYTDFEDADPANKVAYPSGASTDCGGSGTSSAAYWYDTPSGSSTTPSPTSTSGHRSGCAEIQFAAQDVLNGKVHFNDTPLIGSNSGSTKATFTQGYETSDPNCVPAKSTTLGYCYRSTSGGTPNVGSVGANYAPNLQLADNSDQFVNYPGCNYYGDTRIRFNSDGTMTVWNTDSSGQDLTGPNTPSGTNCGDSSKMVQTSATDQTPSSGQTIPVPNDMVIYVRNSGTSAPCAPGQVVNGTASGSTSGDVIPQGSGSTSSGTTDVSYWLPGTQTTTTVKSFTVTKTGSTYSWTPGTSTANTVTANSTHDSTFDCGQGNVYVEGTLKGRVTIAAEDNVVVTDDLLLNSTPVGSDPTGTDILGLVAANSVVNYHPVQRVSPTVAKGTLSANSSNSSVACSGTLGNNPTTTAKSTTPTPVTCTWGQPATLSGGTYSNLSFPGQTTSTDERWIYASIQTLQHSFWVQQYNQGAALGTLGVRGSIAQRWRGAVGTTGPTGFYKDYSYDARLKFSSPPYFPQWTNATWSAATTGELAAQYKGQ